MFLTSFSLILFELLLTRLFGVVLFAQFAHLALALAMLGISTGAIAQHLFPQLVPEEGLGKRIGALMMLQAGLTLVAVICTLEFPIVVQSAGPIVSYGERSGIKDDLLHVGWFVALLPIISAPFVVAGLIFSGAFQRRKAHIGRLYGADLIGGALGAVLFIPVLDWMAGPDTVWLILAGACGGAAWIWRVAGAGRHALVAGVIAVASIGLAGWSATGSDVLEVRYAAGFSEHEVRYSEWTPLARLSVAELQDGGTYMLLDNTSASEIFREEKRRNRLSKLANRSLIWRLHKPPGRVAVLAASAGPEVAVAQQYGFTEIDAIDIAGEIFDIVATEYPDSPLNPYLKEGVTRVKSDGRAAMLHAEAPYDVIQMVHANLWSSAGLISSAWSPSLLETVEAFETYLDKLTPDGTISFGRGKSTDAIVRSAAEALRRRGVTEPWAHMFYVTGSSTVVLVKPRPFTQAERDTLVRAFKKHYRRPQIVIDPMKRPGKKRREKLFSGAVMTDDRPYLEDAHRLWKHVQLGLDRAKGEKKGPVAVLYRSLVVQSGFVLVSGLVFLLLPFLRRGPAQLDGVPGVGVILGYVACLGYGYLAVETILIHELVLFVGHPTYAVTLVLLVMLLSSGAGAVISGRVPPERIRSTLRKVLLGILALGAIQAFVVPGVLHAAALGSPLAVRMALVFVALLPLGFIMGMPFPLVIRMLPGEASGIVPWAWALNGWMSVVASLVTVLISRTWGYSFAFVVALGAYLLAWGITWLFERLDS